MMPAAAAAEYRANLGFDFTLIDALDEAYVDYEPFEDEDETAAQQALNVHGRAVRHRLTTSAPSASAAS